MVKKLQNVILGLSGIYRPALDNNENRHLIGWYTGMTIAMFFSVAWAALASGYTLYSIRPSITAAIIGCLFTAALIYNLERSVISTPKTGIFWQDAKVLLPRIIITSFLNIGFAFAVEIFLFSNRIDKEVQDMLKEEYSACEESAETQLDNLNGQLDSLNSRLTNQRTAIYTKDSDIKKFTAEQDSLKKENALLRNRTLNNYDEIGKNTNVETQIVDGKLVTINTANGTAYTKKIENSRIANRIKSNTTEIRNLGQAIANRRAYLNPQIKLLEGSLIGQQTNLTNVIKQLTKNKEANIAVCKQQKLASIDFWTKTEALKRIKKNKDMSWEINFVLFVLWIADSIVVLLKMWASKNGYDEQILTLEYKSKIKSQAEISEINDTINEKLEELHEILQKNRSVSVQINSDRLDAELAANEELTDLAARKAFLLAERMVEKWYDEEMKKIDEDEPSNTTNTAESNSQSNHHS